MNILSTVGLHIIKQIKIIYRTYILSAARADEEHKVDRLITSECSLKQIKKTG